MSTLYNIGDVIDVCREADHWAESEGRKVIKADDIERALRQQRSPGSSGAPAEAS